MQVLYSWFVYPTNQRFSLNQPECPLYVYSLTGNWNLWGEQQSESLFTVIKMHAMIKGLCLDCQVSDMFYKL